MIDLTPEQMRDFRILLVRALADEGGLRLIPSPHAGFLDLCLNGGTTILSRVNVEKVVVEAVTAKQARVNAQKEAENAKSAQSINAFSDLFRAMFAGAPLPDPPAQPVPTAAELKLRDTETKLIAANKRILQLEEKVKDAEREVQRVTGNYDGVIREREKAENERETFRRELGAAQKALHDLEDATRVRRNPGFAETPYTGPESGGRS